MAICNPMPGMCQCVLVAAMALRSVSNILPLYSPYILTRSCVQPYYHIIHLWSSVGIHPVTLYSVFQLSDTFRSRGYTIITPIVNERHNRQKMNSLRINFTVNYLLRLVRKLPEINCAWLVHIRAQITYNLRSAELPLFSPNKSPCFRRMKSMTRAITMTMKTMLTGKMTWATVWVTTWATVWATTWASPSLPCYPRSRPCEWWWRNSERISCIRSIETSSNTNSHIEHLLSISIRLSYP